MKKKRQKLVKRVFTLVRTLLMSLVITRLATETDIVKWNRMELFLNMAKTLK